MKITLPKTLEQWDLEFLDNLIEFRIMEGERLDFKSKRIIDDGGDLEKHICAMANSSGGFIILGLEEDKDQNNNISYKKQGFNVGHEDRVHNTIVNKCFNIDPYPNVELTDIIEKSFLQ